MEDLPMNATIWPERAKWSPPMAHDAVNTDGALFLYDADGDGSVLVMLRVGMRAELLRALRADASPFFTAFEEASDASD
jgi:hypothetical protein